jgi:hypothetical protein
LAENSLFILTGSINRSLKVNLARLLWGFDLSPPTDPVTGKKEEVDTWAYEPGGSMIPKRSKAMITVRGREQKEIITSGWLDAERGLQNSS